MERRPAPGSQRILMVEGTGTGFISQYTHALAAGLARRGVHVKLITGVTDEFRGWNTPFAKESCLKRDPAGWANLARRVSEWRPDIVHFQWVANPFLGLPLIRWWQRRGIRVVYTPHNILPHRSRFLSMIAYRAWYRRMDRVVVRDGHIAWALEELLDVPKERLAFIPENPNLLPELPSLERKPLADLPPREPDELRLLVFGHGGPGKGLSQICRALLSGKPSSRLHLVIAGERALAGVSPELFARLCTGIRVTVLDHYIEAQQVPHLFTASDLLVLPYLKICKTPLADLAADFGLPVLRSDRVEAVRFEENVHGVTVRHDSVSELGTALRRLEAEPRLLQRMAAGLRRDSERSRRLDAAVARHLLLYAAAGCTADSTEQAKNSRSTPLILRAAGNAKG